MGAMVLRGPHLVKFGKVIGDSFFAVAIRGAVKQLPRIKYDLMLNRFGGQYERQEEETWRKVTM